MTSTGTTTRTSAYRDPQTGQNLWVGGGAVNQDGTLKLYLCNKCGGEVVWATSARTGRVYLVNVHRGESGSRFYVKASAHDCEAAAARRAAEVEAAAERSARVEKITQDAETQVFGEMWERTLDEADSADGLTIELARTRNRIQVVALRLRWDSFVAAKLAQRSIADRFPA